MKVSLNWLQRHIEITESVEEIEKILTAVGLEVEGRREDGKSYGSLLVAKVLECVAHPDSDHLSVTKIFDGSQELQVVCGASNVAAGQTVCLAPVGCELPQPDGTSFKMKKAKIRGVESCGMLCAEDEIGLGTSHAGIMVLPDEWQAGTLLVSLGLWDTVLELNVTPNRPDALCHRGVARELAAALGRELKPLIVEHCQQKKAKLAIALEVEADCGCTRYVGSVLDGVQVKESPAWLRRLLQSVGITPINNVVDVTNFVLLDLGQPLHSFDMDKLQGRVVRVRGAKAGETLETIDHRVHQLQQGDLLICDGDKPACVAGVMGGVESEITETTRRVFLETAWFDPTVVRKQSKRLGLSSDSSYRFERGVDPFLQEDANHYAAVLIARLSGAELLQEKVQFTSPNHKQSAHKVELRPSRVLRVLGLQPSVAEIRRLLTGIGLCEDLPSGTALQKDPDSLVFAIPGFRPDLEREIDLIEEVARLVGYDSIPYHMPSFQAEINPLPPLEALGRKVRYTLSALGLHECLSLRFSSRSAVEAVFGPPSTDPRTKPIPLLNPLNEDLGVLPVSLLPTLLRAVSENEKHRDLSVRLFEIGKGQFPRERQNERDTGVCEVHLLAIALAGIWSAEPLAERPTLVEFSNLKGVLCALAQRLHLPLEFRVPENKQAWLHPHRQVELICSGEVLGHGGEVHPAVLEKYSLRLPVQLMELDLEKVLQLCEKQTKLKMFSRQVATTRDISVEVDERFTHQQVLNTILSIPAKNRVLVQLKSIYQGDKLPAGRKNLLYQLTYQAEDRTLTDEEVNKVHEKLRDKLAETGDIVFR